MSTRKLIRSSISPFMSRKPPASLPPTRLSGRAAPAPATSSTSEVSLSSSVAFDRLEANRIKENVTVTVRIRPLSPREIRNGDGTAWYADGDYTVRNESNPSISFGYDKVFGPAAATHHIYDAAAQHVVTGAMQGINGTVFAYGVTSSGKTYTMQGEQKSPGIISLAVKDVFDIIQETPEREFLLRVSYMEIYNEVINDLLDPAGQNLRIREDTQGTYVVGIKEEVVLSPAHTLSLIAYGEEHRHVGSNNFNLLSSRSHTIFTLTIESSPRGENQEEDVRLSQLNLIDLAGSESSKTETTGLRRKEGSYINRSLLTLGSVISKLTDGKSTHIPYRDSKLTRLLQSSLSGYGRISLICTLTPASSSKEETHNTLIFAHRSKHVEIRASQNKIMDDKSLIKKYQKEISCLKQELQQLKCGMIDNPHRMKTNQDDLVNLKLQLEAGQVQLQSRLEEEEQAKAALLGRIQRLTKLILVSTKNTSSTIPKNSGYRRRHSICEDELAYLPNRRRTFVINENAGSDDSEISADGLSEATNLDEIVNDYKMNKRRGALGWFKLKKPENSVGLSLSGDSESLASGSPVSSSKFGESRITFTDTQDGTGKSMRMVGDDASIVEFFPGRNQVGNLLSATVGGRRLLPSASAVVDQMDLLHEQVKMLAGEMALCSSSLKRLSELAANKPDDSQLQEHILKLKDEMKGKKVQIQILEQKIVGTTEATHHTSTTIEMSQALSKLATELNEKTFELEIKSADNRILQEQLQMKVSENAELQQTILLLRQQLDSFVSEKCSTHPSRPVDNGVAKHETCSESSVVTRYEEQDEYHVHGEICFDESITTSVTSSNRMFHEEWNERGSDVRLSECPRKPEDNIMVNELGQELSRRYEREAVLEAALHKREKTEDQLLKSIAEAKRRERDLENGLGDMWMLVAKLKKSGTISEENSSSGNHAFNNEQLIAGYRNPPSNSDYRPICLEGEIVGNMGQESMLEKLKANYINETRSKESLAPSLKIQAVFRVQPTWSEIHAMK